MKKNYVCTWCSQQVAEVDFDLHSKEHYAEQIKRKYHNPSTTFSTIGTVSYVSLEETK